MRKLLIGAALLTAAVTPAPAFAAGTYYVRNDTNQLMTCGVRRPRSQATDPISLRPGAQWSQNTARDDSRTLICFFGVRRQSFRMVSGQRYALHEADDGAIWLRALDGS